MKTRAAILVESKKPLVVDEIELPPLDVGQVLVRVLYTTICGAQINEIDAVKGVDKFLPHLLGHEASGIVEEIGPGVSHVKPGDSVVLHWRPGAGMQAKPATYQHYRLAHGTSFLRDINAGWVTTFQERTVVSENRVTPIPSDFDMKLAPLLGCALTTAFGVIRNDGLITGGQSVVVFGAGGVGLPIVRFAALYGARVLVVEPDSRKGHQAKMAGARYEMHPDALSVPADFRYLLNGDADVVIETTGKEVNSRRGFSVTKKGGSFVGVGVPEPIPCGPEKDYVHRDRYPDLLGKWLYHNERWITQSHGGSCRPDQDIPLIVRMVYDGRLSLDGHITHEYSLDQINDAIAMMRSGTAGRVCIKV